MEILEFILNHPKISFFLTAMNFLVVSMTILVWMFIIATLGKSISSQ